MVDAADQEKLEASKNELHNLLDKPQLQGIPVSSLVEKEGREPAGKLGEGQVKARHPQHGGGEMDKLAQRPWT